MPFIAGDTARLLTSYQQPMVVEEVLEESMLGIATKVRCIYMTINAANGEVTTYRGDFYTITLIP